MFLQYNYARAVVLLSTIHVTRRTVSFVGFAKTTMDSVRFFDVFDNGVLRRKIAVAILAMGHACGFALMIFSRGLGDQGWLL
eukprot:scaffold9178_cov176-Amphora_coffeaeformis.AAC.17